ncbi:MAG: hypothetical protein ACYC6L_00465 [Anaerolineae bacterium]
MSEPKLPDEEHAVEQRENKVVTEQPGYSASEEVVRDVAAEQRITVSIVAQIVWILLILVEVLLGLRFLFKLIAANPESGFASFLYTVSGVLAAPFRFLVPTPDISGSVIEFSTLIAMLVYLLFAWIIVRIIMLFANRPRARVVKHSEHRDSSS